jgi:hypothetical protein
LVGGGEHLTARGGSVDSASRFRPAARVRAGDMGAQLRCSVSQRRQGGDGDDLSGAYVKLGALSDLTMDRLEHVSRQIGRDVAQRAFELLGLLAENFLNLLVAPRRRSRSDGSSMRHSDKVWRGSGKIG